MKKEFWTSVIFLVLLIGELEAGRRVGGGGRSRSGGGGWGSRSSSSSSRSSSGGGWFGSRSSSSNTGSKSNSYPKQQWGSSSGGTNTGAKQPIGGGGFVNPKPASNAGIGGGKQPIGGGGFVNPKQNYGTGGKQNYGTGGSYGSYGSRYGTGAGLAGAGASQYSYRSPGYGTNFGTSFPGGVGRYGGSGYSKKALGLGVGAGFIGGAALGVAGTMATYGVYHRYNQYRMMMMMHGGGYHGYNSGYYNNYYSNNRCFGGCPYAAHCEWGFCECNRGFEKRYGRCEQDWGNQQGRPANFDPFVQCMDSTSCQRMDMNLICNTNLTMQAGGKCECRQDMKWNTASSECQLFIDVDCSSITYDTKPSPVILEAVNKTLDKIAENNKTETAGVELETTPVNGTDPESLKPENATISMAPNETLSNSLLSSIDPNTTSEADLKEAFCRDIDSFSFEFAEPQRQNQNYRPTNSGPRGSVGSIIGTIVAILIFFALCCVCCICCAFKGAKDKLSSAFKSSDHGQEAATGAVAFTAIQEAQHEQSGPPGYHPNPGFQSQPTPMHSGLPYAIQPDGPAPIPPTQPGYTNTYPSLDNEAPIYPPLDNSVPYPPNGGAPYGGAPYPPTGGAPYPPTGGAPYPPAGGVPYPPSNSSPYPPAYPSSSQTPYPPTSAPYPPADQQPAYNPTAPP